jgi:hypothetical protein
MNLKKLLPVLLVLVCAAGYLAYTLVFKGMASKEIEAELQKQIAQLPQGYSVTYDSFEADAISNGFTLKNVTFKISDAKLTDLMADLNAALDETDMPSEEQMLLARTIIPQEISIGELSANGLNTENAEAAAKATPNGQYLKIADTISFHDLKLDYGKVGETTYDQMDISGLELKPVSVPLATLKMPEDGKDALALLPLLVDVIEYVGVEKIDIKGVKNNVVIDLDGESITQNVSYDTYVVENYKNGNTGRTLVTGMKTTIATPVGPISFDIAEIKAEDFNLDGLLKFMRTADMQDIDNLPEGLDTWVSIRTAEVNGLKMDFSNLPEMQDTKIEIGSYYFNNFSHKGLVPTSMHAGVKDMYIKIPEKLMRRERDLRPLLEAGITSLTTSFNLDYAVDEANNTAQIKDLSLEFKDIAKASISTNLAGFDAATFTDPRAFERAITENGALKNAKIRLENGKALDLILDFGHKVTGQPREELRDELIDQLKPLRRTLGTSERAENIMTALEDFIKSPKSITLNIEPATDIPFMQIPFAAMNPSAALEQFNITAEANN